MEAQMSSPTEFLKTGYWGGVVMDAWMIKPPNFDPSKKYPSLSMCMANPTRRQSWMRGEKYKLTIIGQSPSLVIWWFQ
jgi:hypothetical protein